MFQVTYCMRCVRKLANKHEYYYYYYSTTRSHVTYCRVSELAYKTRILLYPLRFVFLHILKTFVVSRCLPGICIILENWKI